MIALYHSAIDVLIEFDKSTLTMSLAIPIPSSSSSNGPTINAVENQGQSPSSSVPGQIQSLFGFIGEGPE